MALRVGDDFRVSADRVTAAAAFMFEVFPRHNSLFATTLASLLVQTEVLGACIGKGNIVGIIRLDGTPLVQMGSGESGDGAGEFNTPVCAVHLSSGHLAISDHGNHRIRTRDDGGTVAPVAGGQ